VRSRLETALRECAIVPLHTDARELIVEQAVPTGYDVCLWDYGDEVIVAWGVGHEHLADEDAAVHRFLLGLSDAGRLLVTRRGLTEVRWVMQVRTGDEWRTVSTTGLLISPFWRRRVDVVLQNTFRVGCREFQSPSSVGSPHARTG